MTYPINVVANWFLNKESMTHKKLQKLCYYAQAWSYALYDRPMVDDEFQAWVHGPVSPKLYDKYRGSYLVPLHSEEESKGRLTSEDEQLLERVWITYGGETANALEALTHTEAPWKEARVGYKPNERSHTVISSATMRDYYRGIYIDGEA